MQNIGQAVILEGSAGICTFPNTLKGGLSGTATENSNTFIEKAHELLMTNAVMRLCLVIIVT